MSKPKPNKSVKKHAKPEATKHAGGRPSKYKPEYAEQAYKLCLLGHTDKELAEFFEVNEDTIHEWKKVHEDFSESIKKGKGIADGNVVESLYKSAMGYEHPDTDIRVCDNAIVETPITKYYPPNPTSLVFWLKNRQPKQWRDKHEVEAKNTNVNVSVSKEEIKEINDALENDC